MSVNSQWVTFKVGEETFGFEIEYVREMLRLPRVHPVPHSAADNMGVIVLRSKTIPIFDLAQRFGVRSKVDEAVELNALLRARQVDHENWLKELEACITENREFTLATDPHKCKFGQWYDNYQAPNVWLRRLLGLFDAPHKAIHAVAIEATELQSKGEYEKALALIQHTRTTVLAQMIRLFHEAITEVETNDQLSLIVVGSTTRPLGVAVDEIDAVVSCTADEIQAPDSIPGIEDFGGLIGLLPQKGSDKFIMLLDPAQIYPQLIAPANNAPLTCTT
ncbi:MAG: chemotaxis protein CheW [Calditrichota bacterium]